jgi:short subunit dehydrogenase-like uncharacterized protein
MANRSLDIAIFGATGFTGALVAEYLTENATSGQPLRLALAGRSREKLETLRARLVSAGSKAEIQIVIADVSDAPSLHALASKTKVLLSTVGPFAQFGLPVVKACAETGTHYCDITGEPNFIRSSIDQFEAFAQANRARIVHTCGFDSIPSDLGMCTLHDFLKTQGLNTSLKRATLGLVSAKGGFSGGTVASLLGVLDATRADKNLRSLLRDPYSLSPDRAAEPNLGPERDLERLEKDAFTNRWTAPFVMESINTRVVRRSNAILGFPYGRAMRYREVTLLKPGALGFSVGALTTAALGALMLSQKYAPTRAIVKRMLPKPGEGPDAETRNSGSFRIRIEAENTDGIRVQTHVAGVRDPGYGETAKMVSEAALCLAFDDAALDKRFGILTPASAMGMTLVKRLQSAGMTFASERI